MRMVIALIGLMSIVGSHATAAQDRTQSSWKCSICKRVLGSTEDHVSHLDAHWKERLRRPDRGEGVKDLWTIYKTRVSKWKSRSEKIARFRSRVTKREKNLDVMIKGWSARNKNWKKKKTAYVSKVKKHNYRVKDFNRRYGGRKLPPDTYRYAKGVHNGLVNDKMRLDLERKKVKREGNKNDRERKALLKEMKSLQEEKLQLKQEEVQAEKERKALLEMYKTLKKMK